MFKKFDHDETRTRNLLIRSQTPYPLGHAVLVYWRPKETTRRWNGMCGIAKLCLRMTTQFLRLTPSWGFCGVVVITSALHAEGREFEPRQNLSLFPLTWGYARIRHNGFESWYHSAHACWRLMTCRQQPVRGMPTSYFGPPHHFQSFDRCLSSLFPRDKHVHIAISTSSRRKMKKTVGGNRSWTGDLSICSRMLCHWAIPPTLLVKDLKLYVDYDNLHGLLFKSILWSW